MKTDDYSDLVAAISQENGFVGGVLILQKANDQGQMIAQHGLTYEQTRECLSIAIYYNEKIELDSH